MDQSVWFVETQEPDDWRWLPLVSWDTRSEARHDRDVYKVVNPGRPFRVKQYKRVEE